MCVYLHALRIPQAALVQNFSSWCNSNTVHGCSEMTGLLSPRGSWVGPGLAVHPSVLIRYCHLLCVPRMEKGWETCLRLSVKSAALCTVEKWKTGLKAPVAESAFYSSEP